MITINNLYRDQQCAVIFINDDNEIADDITKWMAHLLEHFSWILLSILIPALIMKIAMIDIPSKKKNIIGRFNERFRKWICGYENWREEIYFHHTRKEWFKLVRRFALKSPPENRILNSLGYNFYFWM